MAEGNKNMPLPLPGFGPKDSSEQGQIPFPPSPAIPEEIVEGCNDNKGDGDGDGDHCRD